MANILYFAYGSNLLRKRLQVRCPGIAFAGRAAFADHRLTFDKVSADGSGKGAFEAAAGETLFGVLWQVPDREMTALDRAEGHGSGYERSEIHVMPENGAACDVLVYRATNVRPGLRPYEWYLALVIAGAMEHGLPDVYIDKLRAQSFDVDPDPNRLSRRYALALLKATGRIEVLNDLAN
jgi:hypothetical protein